MVSISVAPSVPGCFDCCTVNIHVNHFHDVFSRCMLTLRTRLVRIIKMRRWEHVKLVGLVGLEVVIEKGSIKASRASEDLS